jgi:hypothetical protein
MEKTPESSVSSIPFTDIESGMMAGLWTVPIDGFEWRNDLRAAIADGKIQTKDPSMPSWWLVPKGDVARRYPVLGKPNLARDFYRVGLDPTRPAVLAFAERYGHLGTSTLLMPRNEPTIDPIIIKLGGGSTDWGEAYSLWQTESLAFRNLWETWQLGLVVGGKTASTDRRIDEARRELSARFGWNPDGSIWYHVEVEGAGAKVGRSGWITDPLRHDHDIISSALPEGNLAAVSRYWTIQGVNEAIKGSVNPTILPLHHSELRFVPENLRAAIYLRFALEISDGIGQVRECAGCSRPFTPARRDQIYCGKNCRERASYRKRTGGPGSERDLARRKL